MNENPCTPLDRKVGPFFRWHTPGKQAPGLGQQSLSLSLSLFFLNSNLAQVRYNEPRRPLKGGTPALS